MADRIREEWGVFNDPAFYEPRFANGELHPQLRELIEAPLWVTEVPAPAKRYAELQNQKRTEEGKVPVEGLVKLRMRKIVEAPWRTVEGAEYDQIDDGKRAYGG